MCPGYPIVEGPSCKSSTVNDSSWSKPGGVFFDALSRAQHRFRDAPLQMAQPFRQAFELFFGL